mgnify:CR=1 FL=1
MEIFIAYAIKMLFTWFSFFRQNLHENHDAHLCFSGSDKPFTLLFRNTKSTKKVATLSVSHSFLRLRDFHKQLPTFVS